MDREGGCDGSCYYSILGIRRDASFSDIRNAYRKLALKWHPDRWTRNPTVAGEAKRRFQQIQGAYSVLSDEGKKSMYDAGFYDPFEEEDEGFCDFMQEMLAMMEKVSQQEDSFEDLQRMFVEMTRGVESVKYDGDADRTNGKTTRVASTQGGAGKRSASRFSVSVVSPSD